MAIQQHPAGIEIDFNGVNHLFTERQAQYNFILLPASGKVLSPNNSLSQSDFSEQGAIDLIAFIRDFALGTEEDWDTPSTAQTIYIKYYSWNFIMLANDDNVVTEEDLLNGAQKIFVSHDVSDTGLLQLVNDLLDWMNE